MKLSLKTFGLIGASLAVLVFAAPVDAQPVQAPLVSTMGSADAFQDIYGGYGSTTNLYASIPQIRSYVLGQNSQHLTAPVPTITTSICGGSAATVSGTDTSGQVTEGSTASTSCVLTFAKAFATAPECFVSINNVADTALKCSTSTTAATVTQTSASSNVLNYLIVGLPGG